MSNKKNNFTVPGDEIKLLLKIRGQSQTSLAATTGISLYVLNKFLNNITFISKKGHPFTLQVPHIKTAISQYLNIPNEILWSSAGSTSLRKIIADEMIVKKSTSKRLPQKQETKPWRFTTFIKNIVSLGKRKLMGVKQ